MINYDVIVHVTSKVPFEERDFDDQQNDPTGDHEFEILAKGHEEAHEKALDVFHNNVPIAMLEDFDIDVEINDACPD
jgi:hypothetical protein